MLFPTYIPGLDTILHGGLMQSSSILVAGPTGSGRTLTCLQSLFEAAKAGEKCVYVTILSEPVDKLLQIARNYSFFDDEMLDCGNLKFLELNKEILTKGDYTILKYFHDLIMDKPERVVLDSVTVLLDISSSFDEERELLPLEKRAFLVSLFQIFATSKTLLLMTGDLTGDEISTSALSHLSDVIIEMGNQNKVNNDKLRYVEIVKSRGRDFTTGRHDLKLSVQGSAITPRNLP